MSSYGLHLANLAEARGLDLAAGSVETILCSAEALSDAKRAKLSRHWGARVVDTFGMTEAGMMGAEDAAGGGFRIWTDMFLIEVLDPETFMPVQEGAVGTLVVTPLWTNNVTPFLRWSSGDLVTEDHGLAHPHGAEAAMVEVVQVRSADTAGLDRDLDLAGRGHLNFTFLDPQITGRMNDDGLHGCTPRGWW